MPAIAADPATVLILTAAMLAAGVAAGFIAGLLGVGGGLVVVPAVFHALAFVPGDPALHMHMAVGTSLATIVPTGLRSARAHHARGAVDAPLLWRWGPAVLVGVALGSALAGLVAGTVLSGIFGVVAVAAAIYMAAFGQSARLAERLPREPARSALGAGIGAISAMMGIGGGTLSVPTLSLCGYPIRRAVGTAAAIGLIIAVPGSLGFVIAGWDVPGRPALSLGYVNLVALAAITPSTVVMAPLGARVAHAIPRRALRVVFAGFLLLVGTRMLWQTWSG